MQSDKGVKWNVKVKERITIKKEYPSAPTPSSSLPPQSYFSVCISKI